MENRRHLLGSASWVMRFTITNWQCGGGCGGSSPGASLSCTNSSGESGGAGENLHSASRIWLRDRSVWVPRTRWYISSDWLIN